MQGDQLKAEICRLGMTTAEFSRLSDISTRTLSKIYKNQRVRVSTVNKAWRFLRAVEKRSQRELQERAEEAPLSATA